LDFPDSLNVIVELKETVDKTNTLNELSERLQNELKTRLLIPGVITQYIINQYINILKVLQILDPSGMIFGELIRRLALVSYVISTDKVTQPIRQHLLKRSDTLRCIITLLSEDS
jgi:anaphase-promoting complex subunit 2